jgi:hypothetical protein
MPDQVQTASTTQPVNHPARTPRRIPDRPWFKPSPPPNARRPKPVLVPESAK